MLKEIDIQYNLMSLVQKYQHKEKLTSLRQEYEALRIKFFKMEDEELRKSMG